MRSMRACLAAAILAGPQAVACGRGGERLPAIPLEKYTFDDIRREYLTRKACADYCTIACVHQVATFDLWRDPQTLGVKGAVRHDAVKAIQQSLYQIE